MVWETRLELHWEHVTQSDVEPGESSTPTSFRNNPAKAKEEVAGAALPPAYPGTSSFSTGLTTAGNPGL